MKWLENKDLFELAEAINLHEVLTIYLCVNHVLSQPSVHFMFHNYSLLHYFVSIVEALTLYCIMYICLSTILKREIINRGKRNILICIRQCNIRSTLFRQEYTFSHKGRVCTTKPLVLHIVSTPVFKVVP